VGIPGGTAQAGLSGRKRGGSDANAFRLAGFRCLNLANGTERPHQPTERVSAQALEGGLELALALLSEAELDTGDGAER